MCSVRRRENEEILACWTYPIEFPPLPRSCDRVRRMFCQFPILICAPLAVNSRWTNRWNFSTHSNGTSVQSVCDAIAIYDLNGMESNEIAKCRQMRIEECSYLCWWAVHRRATVQRNDIRMICRWRRDCWESIQRLADWTGKRLVSVQSTVCTLCRNRMWYSSLKLSWTHLQVEKLRLGISIAFRWRWRYRWFACADIVQ